MLYGKSWPYELSHDSARSHTYGWADVSWMQTEATTSNCSRRRVVTLDVQTLGEYQTSISRIRVSDDGGKVIWEVKARGRAPQIHKINLRCGANTAHIPEFDEYELLFPRSSEAFVLKEKRRYSVEVWAPKAPLPSRAAFELAKCGQKPPTEPFVIP
jgi:hypothetical protein